MIDYLKSQATNLFSSLNLEEITKKSQRESLSLLDLTTSEKEKVDQ